MDRVIAEDQGEPQRPDALAQFGVGARPHRVLFGHRHRAGVGDPQVDLGRLHLAGFDARDRQMFGTLIAMIVRDRFLGSQLGRLWAVLSPAVMLSIFSFVFTVVFPQRLAGSESSITFLIWLISGYGPWLSVSEGLSAGAGSVVGSAGIIKNIAFKSELLPMAAAVLGVIPLVVSFVVLFVLIRLNKTPLNIYWFFIPFVILIQFIFVSGIALFLSSITVFVRDTLMIIPSVLTMILFLSPVFFPIESLPEVGRRISQFNPIFVLADSYRQPIIHGLPPDLLQLAYLAAIAALVFFAGLRFFRRLKPYFASRV